MTSFVTDLLQSTGKLAKENIVLKIYDLKRKLEDTKLEVHESLKNRYIDFIPQYVELDNLIDSLNNLQSQYNSLHNQIEKEIKPQLVNSAAEFSDVMEDLKRAQKLRSIALNICLLHQHLEGAKNALSDAAYLNSSHRLLDFQNVMKLIDLEHQKDIAIICALRAEYFVTKEDVIYHLQKAWRHKIVIDSSLEGKNKKCITLTFNQTMYEEIDKDLLTALKLLDNLKFMMKEFGKQFLTLVCEMLLLHTVKVKRSENSILTMTIISEHSPCPTEAFEILNKIFMFLQEEFFHLPVLSNGDECSSAMNELGMAIGDDFCSLVIEKCLKEAIPKHSKELDAFSQEISAAENFCNTLQNLGFLPCAENKLLNFLHNVDVLPVNKMAQNILSRARQLMEKSLHQTVSVGVAPSPAPETEDPHDLNEMARTKSGLSKSTFSFPRCEISISVKNLTSLLYEVKEEAKNIGPAHAPRLYYVGRNICELYCCVVPTFHKEEIEKIPQQTAIYHNNCMYLADRLCTLNSHYECDIASQIPMTFVDLVPEIRKLGAEAFLAQMRNQRHQLLQLLQGFQNSMVVDDGVVNKAEKSTRQCLCQLLLLKKVWSDVLPIEVYFKAIGTLFNTCLEEIILRILSMEDIAAKAAAHLDSIFAILLKQGPDLFKVTSVDKSDFVHLYVRQWFKFQELQLILSASMREIVDRWASGKGPLTTHFTSEEVKHLIRALFQNTERRAAALAKIR